VPKNGDLCLLPHEVECEFDGCFNYTNYAIVDLKAKRPKNTDFSIMPFCATHLSLIETNSKRGFGKCSSCKKRITVFDLQNILNTFKYWHVGSLCWSCIMKKSGGRNEK
jgi:hypothetical protein